MIQKNKRGFIARLHDNSNAIKAIIILTVFIDVVGLGIVIPVLPYYVESFGATPFVVTLLFSVFAFFSFVSGPFLGALSDRVGRRPILILSIISSAIGWFVFAGANSLWVLFLGRIIDGAAAGNFPIAQSYLVDIAKNDKERTSNLGIIGAVWGAGFIIGPALGAFLSTFSAVTPFLFVGVLAMLNALGAIFLLPETHKNRAKSKKISVNPFSPLLNAAKDSVLRSRYLAWFLFGISFASFNSIFSLYASSVFGFSATKAGYLFTGMGVVIVVNQVFALNKVWLKHFREQDLEVWFFLIMAGGFLLADFKFLSLFALGLFFITVGQSTLRVVISSGVAGVAGVVRRGEVMGIMSSILSVSMIIGPLVGGALFVWHSSLPFLLNVFLLIVAFFIMKKCGGEKILKMESVEVMG